MITQLMQDWWQQFTQYRYYKEIVGGFITVVVVLSAYAIYDAIVYNTQVRAHKVFVESCDLYKQALASQQQSSALWKEVEDSFAQGRNRASGSPLAPYFRAFESESAVQQNNNVQAIAHIDALLAAIDRSAPLYYLYKTKGALLKMDSTDELVRRVGLDELISLSQDGSNKQRDTALYYLGLYYFVSQDFTRAQQVWTELKGFSEKSDIASPWYAEIKARLPQQQNM